MSAGDPARPTSARDPGRPMSAGEHPRPATTGELIWTDDPPFARNASEAVHNSQLRRNVRNATATIRQRRAGLVAETPDWQELRHAGAAIKDDVLHHLDEYLTEFERNATANGAHVTPAYAGFDGAALV